uniref:Uncharacterized protein n=1 Tax=Ciona intestinalis TaxID=7719 RepID=H2XVK5_CIOIN
MYVSHCISHLYISYYIIMHCKSSHAFLILPILYFLVRIFKILIMICKTI